MQISNWRFLVILALFIPFLTEDIAAGTSRESPGQVWQVGANRWDTAQEQRFAEWMEKTITEDFFIRYKIPVDCADVPYALRWIYARIAHLPAAVTTGDGHLLGHWSTAWSGLPTAKEWYRDRRFRQSLLAVLQKTTTETLPLDTYPIRIANGSVAAGAVFIGEGHSGIVGRIVYDGSTYSPVQTWEATLPIRVTKLRQRNYFASWTDSEASNGLVRFRWPVLAGGRWQLLSDREHPYYSLEQYSRVFCRPGEPFDQAVARRIDPTPYDPAKRVRLIIDSIHRYLLERVALVQAGFKHCRRGNCPEGSTLWEEYSTPGRDDVISFQITHLQRLIKEHGLDNEGLAITMETMVIPINAGQTVTVQHVVQNRLWLSHNPGDSIDARWGLSKCDMIRSQIQSSLVALDFSEQRYRSTDPLYADRRHEQTMSKLMWLQNQGKIAGCIGLPHLPLEEAVPLPVSASPQLPVSERSPRSPPPLQIRVSQ